METWREALLFAHGIGIHWVALVTGSAATAIATAFGAHVKKYSPWWILPLALLGGFLPASYLAWTDQHDQLVVEMRLHHPQFTLNAEITEAIPHQRPNEPPHTLLLFQMQVTNSGAASICQGWIAFVTNQQSVVQGERTVIPDGMILMRGGGLGERYQREHDNLIVKTTESPIPENGMVPGWILFDFDLREDQLTALGNMVNVSCIDPLWERYWDIFPASEIKISNAPDYTGKIPFNPDLSAPQEVPKAKPPEMLRKDSGEI